MVDTVHNKRPLYIIGAGGFGREVESWIDGDDRYLSLYELRGFIDDNSDALEGYPSNLSVVGGLDYEFEENSAVILAIARTDIKEAIFKKLEGKVEFISFVDKSVRMGKYVTLGKGTLIAPNCILSTNVKVGDGFVLNSNSQIGHDCVLDDFVSIMANVTIGGGVKIGSHVTIGSGVNIIPRILINSGIVVGLGAVVFKSLRKVGTYMGNPSVKVF